MDALTATKAGVFVLDIKTIPALHITNQPRQKSSTVSCLSQPTDQWISKKSAQLYRCTVSLGSGTRCKFELLPRLVCEMKKGGGGFDVDDEYARFCRRQRIHRMHLVGYVVFAALVLIGMLIFWH